MSRVKQAFWRIGSPDAVTWLSFWLTFTGALIASFVSTSGGISWAFRLGVVGIGQLLLWVPLVVARRVALRMDPDGRTPIATVILGAFCLGATVRTLFIGLAFIWVVGPEAALWPTRIFGSFGTIGLVFALTGYAVSSAREQRRRIQVLHEVQADLERSVTDVRIGIEERGEQSVRRVRSILEAELASLRPDDAGAAVDTLERLARDVVRPLSHELANAPASPDPYSSRGSVKVTWVKVLDVAAQGSPFRPLVTALLLLIMALGSISAYPAAATPIIIVPIACFVAISTANLMMRYILAGRSLPARLIILVAAAVTAGALTGAFAYVVMNGQPVQRGIALGSMFFTTVFALGIAATAAFDTDRRLTIARLNEATTRLRRNLALINQVRWFQEKALSRSLHGPVQTSISAAALKLDAALKAGTVTPELINQLRDDVARDLDVLSGATRNAVPLMDGIGRIVITWEGVCAIDVRVGAGVVDVAAMDAPLTACAIGIASEAISNAIRHGGSTAAVLHIDFNPQDESMLIDVRSQAPPSPRPPLSTPSGLGTRHLDECTTSWALDVAVDGQHLRAVLPSRLVHDNRR